MKLTIEGSVSLDGTYDADLTYFTQGELHQIKKQTGLRAGEFNEAFEAGDSDMMVAVAACMLQRVGKDNPWAELWALPAGKITLDLTEAEAEEEAEIPPPSEPDAEEQRGSESAASGSTSNGAGDSLPENVRSLTGNPPSATGAISDLATSQS